MYHLSKFELLALLVSQVIVVGAQTCNTSSPFDVGYNASGSVQTAGFRVNASYPESTWTWTQYVVEEQNAAVANRSAVWQTFGLQTSPVQDLTDPSLPYTACIIALANFPTNNNGAQDNGTCNTVFSSACYAEIISTVNRTASQWSNTATASSSSLACTGLLGGINSNSKSACYNQWFGTFSSRFIQNDFTSQNNSACSTNTNPGASDFTHRSFFSWSEGTQAKGNYTAYDNILLHPQPVIVAAFLKNTNSAGGQTTGSESAWADTRLLCLPANITTPDSRNITVARKESGASRAHSVVVRILGIVAFTVLVELS